MNREVLETLREALKYRAASLYAANIALEKALDDAYVWLDAFEKHAGLLVSLLEERLDQYDGEDCEDYIAADEAAREWLLGDGSKYKRLYDGDEDEP